MRHAVIMAGGAGTRLWPLSRRMRPKQLMRLFDGASLLQLSRQRLAGVFDAANIWVITSAAYLDQVARELPDIPRENLIGEPIGRDTANAIGLAASLIALRDPSATMSVFTADHLIGPQDEFAATIRAGLKAAEKHDTALVTFGVTPDSPHTGYGYIRRGPSVGPLTHRVLEFKEKPTRDVADAYVRSGEYLWNSGMFSWRVAAIRRELERSLPDNARALDALAANWVRLQGTPEHARRFAELTKISIDFGVMEQAEQVLVVEMRCRWLDVGSWTAIGATRPLDGDGNASVGSAGLSVRGNGNILVSESDHLIVTLGISDIIVVHSDDATLVCHRDCEQEIRTLAKFRTDRFGERFE